MKQLINQDRDAVNETHMLISKVSDLICSVNHGLHCFHIYVSTSSFA